MMQRIILAAGVIFLIGLSSHLMGETSLFINIKSGILVLGGTIVVGLLSFPMKSYRHLFNTLYMPFKYNETDSLDLAKHIEKMSRVNRLYGNLALEKEVDQTDNLFLRKGIELVVDGYDPYEIHKIMEKEYELYFSRKESVVNILSTLQKLAPVIGF
ncbi:MAG: MotA/TolQ/ExbB proton channel family protein, partial [Desulfobacterales bacterium]